ncbi:HD domain-containing protein [Candidatus Woesebacteria bacterium]|nr:HD domain-containing protein [Candidatus Woesebacteria bacterium]
MKLELPISVLCIVMRLQQAGYTAEIVGGAVRDVLLNVPTKDWDITTNAKPEEILPLFTDSFYENNYGTVMVAQKHLSEQCNFPCPAGEEDLIFDITTYRSDGEYRNHRQPEDVTWGTTIEEDLKRRDFTINAISLSIGKQSLESLDLLAPAIKIDCTLIDPFSGQADLEAKRIRTVGVASERLNEDALRMLRAIRFAVTLGFVIDQEVGDAIAEHAASLSVISWERKSSEFLKMIASPSPSVAILFLDRFGLLENIVPELLPMKGVKQSGHHIYDVWEHSIRALEACSSPDPVVRLATLMHDVGKPLTFQQTDQGTITFYNHEVVGARVAKQVAGRLRLAKHDCDRVFTLVRWHMFTYESFATDAYIRRFIRRVGLENIEDMFALRTGDRVGSGSKASSWRLEELKERIWAELHQPLKITDLAINGNDIMQTLSISPGPLIGKILNALLEDVLEDPAHNTKEYLQEMAKKLSSDLAS